MRIAVLTEYYPNHDNPASGVYVHVRTAAYVRRGEDVRVYLVRNGELRDDSYKGVPVVAGGAETIRAEIERFGPDVIALHTPYPGVLHTRVAESVDIPRVIWIHGYEAMFTALHGYQRGFHRFLSLPYDFQKLLRLRRSLHEASAVVYVSEWMQRTAERSMRYRHKMTRVIPNAVDTERFRPSPARPGIRPMRGLALRGLRAKYGLDLAVRAFAGAEATDLTIVGTGPDADRLRIQISRSKASVCLEERSINHAKIPELMSRFDYFVAPARTEAQGVAMCEAMACGLPVVATSAGGIPEFVRDGVDGFLVAKGDAGDLGRAVRKMIENPERARTMGLRAREHVQAKCSVERVIPQELEILAGALKT